MFLEPLTAKIKKFSWCASVCAVVGASFVTAPAHPGQHGVERNAPDNQKIPLDVGTTPEIPEDLVITLTANVVDADNGNFLPNRVRITDDQGRYYPPLGHSELGDLIGHVNNVTLEPDVINRGNRTWAMIDSGRFTVRLRAGQTYRVRIAHGLEYNRLDEAIVLKGEAGKTIEKTFELKQGIDMRTRGWMSADSHVHSLSPEGALRQMKIEDVDYTNLMFIGPEHPLFTRGLVTGKPHPVSSEDRIVYVSQEVRDMEQGHLTLLGMTYPIEPVLVYTGTGKNEPEPRPNEPLNWQVTQRMRDQDGLAFHAHFLFWPGHGSAMGGALNLLDGLEWTSTDIVNNQRRTRQGLVVPGYETNPTGADSGRLYYRMLNCGVRLPLIGGTDKMSAARPVGSVARTYARVDEWSHEGFLKALGKGNTFVTNGPLLNLTANGQPIGSNVQFTGEGPFAATVSAECFSQRPINYIQIIRNGEVVHELRGKDLPKENQFVFQLEFSESGWLAMRAGHESPDPEDWWGHTMAAHTSPIYVTINDQPPVNSEDAEYLLARMNVTLNWARSQAIWSTPASKLTALDSIAQARKFYEKVLQRAKQ